MRQLTRTVDVTKSQMRYLHLAPLRQSLRDCKCTAEPCRRIALAHAIHLDTRRPLKQDVSTDNLR